MSDYGPQVKLTRLYERASKKTGNQYFTGRLGAAKIVVLKSKDVTEEGGAIWDVLLQEGASEPKRSVVFEFLAIMSSAPILPLLLRPAQHLLVRAAVELTPRWMRTILGLNGRGLHPWEAEVLRQAGALADRLVLQSNPAVQACWRLGLPADYLYVGRRMRGAARDPGVGTSVLPSI